MIIPVFLISIDNAARAEFLLTWCHQLSNRQQRGHALLVFDGTHPEFIDRCRAVAELAFESHDILTPASKDAKDKMASAVVRRNNMFLTAAQYCQMTYRCPFLFMEPECSPTNPQWLENLEKAYDCQPRRYLLCHLQDSKDAPRFPLGVGVFHMGLFNDIAKACSDAPETPWERVAGEVIVSRFSTKSRAFQPLKVTTEADMQNVWPDAQIVVGDTAGALIEHFREQGVHLPKQYVDTPIGKMQLQTTPTVLIEPRVTLDTPNPPTQLTQPNPRCDTPKIDLRTKAGRALKAAQVNGNGH